MNYVIPEPQPVPDWITGKLPAQAMADLLRRHKAELAQADQQLAQAQKRMDKMAARLGLAVWKKRGAANAQEFRLFWDVLEESGIELVDHVGRPVAGELEEMADIIDWVESADGIEPGCVAEAFEPEILVDGRLAHRAKLVGVLETEPETELESEVAESTDPVIPPEAPPVIPREVAESTDPVIPREDAESTDPVIPPEAPPVIPREDAESTDLDPATDAPDDTKPEPTNPPVIPPEAPPVIPREAPPVIPREVAESTDLDPATDAQDDTQPESEGPPIIPREAPSVIPREDAESTDPPPKTARPTVFQRIAAAISRNQKEEEQ
ncbi:MAG: hypothetical protein FWG16_00840 [Micrococcales bacterium]|nr:hypothetical protein [Micrococcales bacterium]